MSFAEFGAIARERERVVQMEWEVARWQEWHRALSPNGYKQGSAPRSPKAMYQFPWEGEDAPRVTRADCHIDAQTLAWLEERHRLYLEKHKKAS